MLASPLPHCYTGNSISAEGTDTEYLRRVDELKEIRDQRLFVAEAYRQYELHCAEEEFERERLGAEQDFEVRETKVHSCTRAHAKVCPFMVYKVSCMLL